MKKILAILLALCLMGTMAACGGNDTDNSSDGSSSGNSSVTDEVVNIADFEGVWKLDGAAAKIIKIDAANAQVTAYSENGIAYGTFAAVATADGLALKMGALGDVVVKSATELTVTALPTVTLPSIEGEWTYIWGDLPDDTSLSVTDGENFVINGTKEDSGKYTISDNIIIMSPSGELGGGVSHEVIGGGDVLHATTPSERYYVRKSAMDTDTGKALYNYYTLIANAWSDADGSMSPVFGKDGKLLMSGSELGFWYPTAAGATVEYTDGSKDDIVIADGSFTLNYFGKTFSK